MSAYAMVMTTPKQAFLALQREWYQKLKDTGFRDLENLLPGGGFGDLLASPFPSYYTTEHIERHYSYYAKVRRFSLSYAFPTELHRDVWRLHGEGLTHREIAKRVGRHHARVQAKLADLADVFRHWVDPADLEEGAE